jgi:predicted dehydrogenase
MKKFKVGIAGVHGFGRAFIHLFQKHPNVSEVYLADLNADILAERAREFGIKTTFPSLEEMCDSDCDCIAIYTQRWLHAPQAVRALKSGKHVYCAVPAAVSLEELDELVATVKSTGQIYMMGETSYYRPQSCFCRQKFQAGEFGKFVYGEGQYYHDMSHFYTGYQRSNGEEWKKFASVPPMYYPTHSTAFILGVTFRRMTEVSCFGYVDDHPDGIFKADLSNWGNIFSNQSALVKTSDGGMARINEFRRVGEGMDGRIFPNLNAGAKIAGDSKIVADQHESLRITGDGRMSFIGTEGSYQEQVGASIFSHMVMPEGYLNNIPFEWAHKLVDITAEDVSQIRDFDGFELTEENLGDFPKSCLGKTVRGISRMQPYHQLPAEFLELKNGHAGTHVFLVNDFVRAVAQNKMPQNNVWQAARYTAPGIVAHESCKRGGELMKIPDFGMPDNSREPLDPKCALLP